MTHRRRVWWIIWALKLRSADPRLDPMLVRITMSQIPMLSHMRVPGFARKLVSSHALDFCARLFLQRLASTASLSFLFIRIANNGRETFADRQCRHRL